MPSQIKGTAIQIFLDWLEAELPGPQVESILARLAAPTRAVLEALLPSIQYAYSLYAEMLVSTQAVLGREYERLAWKHGHYAADLLLAGVYKSTLKAGDVERTLQSMARGWQIFFDTGAIEIAEQKPGRYVFVISDAKYHPLHPPISAGYVKRACEIAGASQVSVEVHGAPPRVEMVIAWATPSS